MECNIIQEFKGEIGGVEFDDKNIYYASQFILEKIEDKLKDILRKMAYFLRMGNGTNDANSIRSWPNDTEEEN